jgi:mono/diheme cytochrome c family protein
MAAQSASDLAKGDAAKGKEIYAARKCATCHRTDKDDAKGGKMSTILGDALAKMSAADIKGWLTDTAAMEAKLAKPPVVKMSAYIKNLKPALTEAEVANLVAYLKTLPAKS